MISFVDGFGFISDLQLREDLRKKHKIYGKAVGVTKQTRQNSAFLDPPYLLD